MPSYFDRFATAAKSAADLGIDRGRTARTRNRPSSKNRWSAAKDRGLNSRRMSRASGSRPQVQKKLKEIDSFDAYIPLREQDLSDKEKKDALVVTL